MLESSGQAITPQMVQTFARTARERIRIDGGGHRREHLRALAQRIEVADREVGSKSKQLQTLTATSRIKPVTSGVRSSGGRSGIRTHEGAEPPAGFQDQCLKPLGHPSIMISMT
jgi:site-specific DNA recombinase